MEHNLHNDEFGLLVRRKGYFFAVIVLTFISMTLWLYGNVTLVAFVEEDARNSQAIPTDWNVVTASGDELIVMLFYDTTSSSYVGSIYKKSKYFPMFCTFKLGGSVVEADATISEIHMHGTEEYVIASIGSQEIEQITVCSADATITKLRIEDEKPFVLVISKNACSIKAISWEGQEIQPNVQWY